MPENNGNLGPEQSEPCGSERRPDGTFLPGHSVGFQAGISGNPKGRPKGRPISDVLVGLLTTQIRPQLGTGLHDTVTKLGLDPETATWRELIAQAMVTHSVRGKGEILRLLLERVEGKVPDKVEHDFGAGGIQIVIKAAVAAVTKPDTRRLPAGEESDDVHDPAELDA